MRTLLQSWKFPLRLYHAECNDNALQEVRKNGGHMVMNITLNNDPANFQLKPRKFPPPLESCCYECNTAEGYTIAECNKGDIEYCHKDGGMAGCIDEVHINAIVAEICSNEVDIEAIIKRVLKEKKLELEKIAIIRNPQTGRHIL